MKAQSVPTGMPRKSKKIRMEDRHPLAKNPVEETPTSSWKVEGAVRGALRRLSHTEREVVERFFFCGEKFSAIGTALGISDVRAYAVLKEARRRLKEWLAPFVQTRYGIPMEVDECPICRSEKRAAIEKLLKTKTQEETWKKVLRTLKAEFQIQTSARTLARHLNRHQKPAKKKCGESTA